jgi:A118 family predicted phage portal protein
MADTSYSIPDCITRALAGAGLAPDTSMQGRIQEWWGWYTSTAGFYDQTVSMGDGRTMRRHRVTIHPARRVCREWASLLLNDSTTITADSEDADEWLKAWLHSSRLVQRGQGMVERAFALGTGAWALSFDVADGAVVATRPRRYDARQVLPLSWDEDSCDSCAFASVASIRGQRLDQLQVHAPDPETGTYHVLTRLFDRGGREVGADAMGVLGDFDTGSALPTFALVRPAIDNVYSDGSAMGQSVFADATGAITAVDNAFDSIVREIDATKVKTLVSDQMFGQRVEVQADGTERTVMAMPSPDDSILRVMSTDPDLISTFAPDIRIDPLRQALDVALDELGDLTGFGQQYFALEKTGGTKTATEVAADNSALMRNVAKHGHLLQDAIAAICEAALAANGFDGVSVSVDLDDSIIADTASDKAQMLAEVSAGLVPGWMYLQRFYGMTEEDARAAASEAAGATAAPLIA